MTDLGVERVGSLLRAWHPAYEINWDLMRGGTLVYLHDRRNEVTLVDARQGGPCPDIVIAASATLEELHHDIRMSAMGACEVESFANADQSVVRLCFRVLNAEIAIEREVTLTLASTWIQERITLQNVCDYNLLIDRYPDWEVAGKTAVAGDLYHWGVNPGGVDVELNGLRIGGDYANTSYVHPAAGYPFFYNHGRFADMGDTQFSLVGGHHGALFPCVMAWNETLQAGVLLSCMHDRCLRYLHVAADQTAQTGTITAQVWWARWLAPRERQEVATWHLVPFTGDYGDMLAEYRQWLNDVHGIHAPMDGSARVDEMFVGTFPHPTLTALGDYAKLIPYADAAARLGCTAIWAAPAWLDSTDVEPRAWISRCQPQTQDMHYGLCPKFGGEASLRVLLAHLRARRMLNVAWITGYGLTSFDPLFREHPEMMVRLRRSGRRTIPERVPGHDLVPDYNPTCGLPDTDVYSPFGGTTVGADTTHPLWRQFWLHNQDYWVRHGVDGVFFDSFNPMTPNYALRPWPGQISLEIINLQREVRRKVLARQPEFFTFTEGGGYLMATVNDFTHAWHGSSPPPLPPYRQQPLSPEEEARFHRDELLSMIVGARAWAYVAKEDARCLPRVWFNLFSGKMPVLPMYQTSASAEPITNEPEYWAHFVPRPVDDPAPAEQAHWEQVARLWALRQSTPELKSGRVEFQSVTVSDAGVFAFLRERDGRITMVVLNFRDELVTCHVRVDWTRAGFEPVGELMPVDLLGGAAIGRTSAAGLATGYPVTVAARNGVVLRLTDANPLGTTAANGRDEASAP